MSTAFAPAVASRQTAIGARWARQAAFLFRSIHRAIVPPMPEPDADLTPARPEDLRACIAYALAHDGGLAKAQSAELMALIVAERLFAASSATASWSCNGRRCLAPLR
jgi:hypothetical protein